MAVKEEYIAYISNGNNIRKIPTGFNKLDNIYGGGLPTGLTILGANTGLGKTTFVLQLADNIAREPNTKVLFFSLELNKYELLSKSLSRLSYLDNELTTHSPNEFITNSVNDIDNYFSKYETIESNLMIIDDTRNIRDISSMINDYCSNNTDKRIVIIIDYLQFISGTIGNDKQNVDNITRVLKSLANRYNISIIGISSLSREGAKRNDTTSFKESGSIEYTADYLIIMYNAEQTRTLTFGEDNDNITLEFLKNRFGCKGKFNFKYYGKYATFVEL